MNAEIDKALGTTGSHPFVNMDRQCVKLYSGNFGNWHTWSDLPPRLQRHLQAAVVRPSTTWADIMAHARQLGGGELSEATIAAAIDSLVSEAIGDSDQP
jgi:hypothetical protein